MIDDLVILDDFFDDPYSVRSTGLNSQFYTLDQYQKTFNKDYELGWKGYRSTVISDIDITIQNFTIEKLFVNCLNDRYKSSIRWSYGTKSNLYFHYLDKSFVMTDSDIHTDTVPYAGLVYLSPSPAENSGTTLFDNNKNINFQVENKFNRLVLYNGKRYHSPANGFGNSITDGRLTLLIFISSVFVEVTT